MAGFVPNSSNIQQVARAQSGSVHLDVHPEFYYWRPEWQKLRDVLAGQRQIKAKREQYLRAMKGADQEDYEIYLERATFYNMTAQTLNGMLGQVFRRPPVIAGLPVKFKDTVRKFAKDGTGHVGFTKTTMGEQIALGRVGVLVDAPPPAADRTAPPASYAIAYSAENIVDWKVESMAPSGLIEPTRVVLREFSRDADLEPERAPLTVAEARRLRALMTAGQLVRPVNRYRDTYTYTTYYRELVLEMQTDGEFAGQRIYVQYLYRDDPLSLPLKRYVPVVRGVPFSFIPFKFFGASSNAADCERPPLLDIADLNISHYRTYAELEYGRLFTALPVYYAPGTDADGASAYHIGPNMVWEVPQGSEPGILEYTGQGLKALETALDDKERQIAAIGGRMVPGTAKSTSESNDQTLLREANEQALLLSVIHAAECGMSDVVRWWLMFRDVPLDQTEGLSYKLNQDFLTMTIGARELRAIQMMYNDGMIPTEALYEYLRKAQVLPDEMSLEDFTASLSDPDSILNAPDAQARTRGFSSRQQELDQARLAREADQAQMELDQAERRVEIDEQKLAIAAKVDSTSVAATRSLGDPEQAPPTRQAKPPTPPPGAAPVVPGRQPGKAPGAVTPQPAAAPKPK